MTEQDATTGADAAETDSEDAPSAADEAADPDAEAGGSADGEPSPADLSEVDPDAALEAGEDADGEVGDELVESVREADPERVARALAAQRVRVGDLETRLDERDEEVDELASKLKRKQADFQNFKKRMEKRREEEKQRATEDLVERLLDVRDNLVRALDQDEDTDIRGGIETTLRQFDDVLEAENVDVIEPEPGTDVDPHRHEVLVKVESDQPEGQIAEVHRPGYVMADKVLRPAQVTVSDGSGGDSDDS